MNFAIVIQILSLLYQRAYALESNRTSCDERSQDSRFRFCLDLCAPCSGSVVELSAIPAVNQNIRNILRNLRDHLLELNESLISAKQEYERRVFQEDNLLISQAADAEELIISTHVESRCEMHVSHLRLASLLTEVSLQMRPLHLGYATQKFLSARWSHSIIQNALCNLKILARHLPGNTSNGACSYSVQLRRLRTGERRTFAMWMLRRINVSVNLFQEIASEYSRIRNQV